MKLKKVESNNIDQIGFAVDVKQTMNSTPVNILRILFTNGRMYDYFDVPQNVYRSFLNSESKGKFFHKHINKKYEYKKVDEWNNTLKFIRWQY